MATREKLLTVRMNAEEMASLEELAKLRRMSASDLVRNLVEVELTQARLRVERERQRQDRYWQSTKDRLQRLVEIAGVKGVSLVFDDARRLVTVMHDGRSLGALEPEGAEEVIAEGSRIAGWSEENKPIVAKTPQAAQEAFEKTMTSHSGDWSKVTAAGLKKLGLKIVDI